MLTVVVLSAGNQGVEGLQLKRGNLPCGCCDAEHGTDAKRVWTSPGLFSRRQAWTLPSSWPTCRGGHAMNEACTCFEHTQHGWWYSRQGCRGDVDEQGACPHKRDEPCYCLVGETDGLWFSKFGCSGHQKNEPCECFDVTFTCVEEAGTFCCVEQKPCAAAAA